MKELLIEFWKYAHENSLQNNNSTYEEDIDLFLHNRLKEFNLVSVMTCKCDSGLIWTVGGKCIQCDKPQIKIH
ncbi:hypothetical protein Phi19:1_gp063 [Cellulophaga phage phi19:1]|uniref:Uncharacterized protein n=1 Tax=Cellulophaga phage phi19:1 TaxID=1327970 RepID=R9ZZG7_9CAUD|nr:hypothetical protein Phi19:1_gp063 [Cellulophaga phage phi19:1]AGO47353.1 hypothetical protein Phi19:1_gp063 [Cellulophaga phage phi19:1]